MGAFKAKKLKNNYPKNPENGTLDPNNQNCNIRWPNFDPKLILEVVYRPIEIKLQLKVGLLSSKTMPKQLLNNSKASFKKSIKRIF